MTTQTDTAWVTPAEAAEILGVTPRTIRNWIKEGRLEAHWVGWRLRIDREKVDSLRRPVIVTRES